MSEGTIFDSLEEVEETKTGSIFDSLDTDDSTSTLEQLPQTAMNQSREEPEENTDTTMENIGRWLYQIPSGALKAYTYVADIAQMMGTGAAIDPEFLEHMRGIHEREGIPFDENKYMQAVQMASETFPTQGNIERMVEEKTGAPLTAKTKGQKLLNFGSSAASLAPGGITSKLATGAGTVGLEQGLEKAGVPEGIAEAIALPVGQVGSRIAPQVSKIPATKSSGMPKRKFESLKKEVKVSPKKHEQITKSLESDLREATEKIIETSPLKKVNNELKVNPEFQNSVIEGFETVQKEAKSIPGTVKTKQLKNQMIKNHSGKKMKGISKSEYEKDIDKYFNEHLNDISDADVSYSDLLDQYRKNNSSLKETFDVTKTKAGNRAKTDQLLAYNKSIADVFEKNLPKSKFTKLFNETNDNWSKIADVKAVETYIDDIFSDKIKFKNAEKIFTKQKYGKQFERALGKEGYKDFKQLIKDFGGSESALKKVKIARSKGFNEVASIVASFAIHPTLGKTAYGLNKAKDIFKSLVNSSLDKPQLLKKYTTGMDQFKKGKFSEATKNLVFVKNALGKEED